MSKARYFEAVVAWPCLLKMMKARIVCMASVINKNV